MFTTHLKIFAVGRKESSSSCEVTVSHMSVSYHFLSCEIVRTPGLHQSNRESLQQHDQCFGGFKPLFLYNFRPGIRFLPGRRTKVAPTTYRVRWFRYEFGSPSALNGEPIGNSTAAGDGHGPVGICETRTSQVRICVTADVSRFAQMPSRVQGKTP